MRLPALAVSAVVQADPSIKAKNPAGLARRLPIDMDLPGEASPSRLETLFARKNRRLASRSVAVAMVLLIIFGGFLGWMNLHKIFGGGAGTAAALRSNPNPNLLKGEGSGRVNILLLGRGGGGHDGPDLTDTMMVASIDPINHKAVLLSLPRDLWVNVPNAGVMKLNSVWETGEFQYLGEQKPGSTDPKAIQAGYKLVDQTVSNVLGLNIDYNVIVNFQAFRQAVDTVGGVTVDVPTSLVDPTMAWENGNNPVLAKHGVQHFNGSKALLYVRSRETSSDFARADRQRALMVALKAKIVKLGTLSNPAKISSLLNTLSDNVQTDLTFKNAQRLYQITKGIAGENTKSLDLDSGNNALVTTGNIDGESIVLPKAGLFHYAAIHHFVSLKLQDPFILKEHAKVLILNGTLIPDLAKRKAKELETYGYNVAQTGSTPSSDWSKTELIDLSHGNDKYTKHYLERRFHQKAATLMPDPTIQTNGADFVIIVGSDEIPTT